MTQFLALATVLCTIPVVKVKTVVFERRTLLPVTATTYVSFTARPLMVTLMMSYFITTLVLMSYSMTAMLVRGKAELVGALRSSSGPTADSSTQRTVRWISGRSPGVSTAHEASSEPSVDSREVEKLANIGTTRERDKNDQCGGRRTEFSRLIEC